AHRVGAQPAAQLRVVVARPVVLQAGRRLEDAPRPGVAVARGRGALGGVAEAVVAQRVDHRPGAVHQQADGVEPVAQVPGGRARDGGAVAAADQLVDAVAVQVAPLDRVLVAAVELGGHVPALEPGVLGGPPFGVLLYLPAVVDVVGAGPAGDAGADAVAED